MTANRLRAGLLAMALAIDILPFPAVIGILPFSAVIGILPFPVVIGILPFPVVIAGLATPARAAADEPTPAPGPRDLAAIKAAGELRIAADPSSGAPYFLAAVAGHKGFEAEMGNAIARRLGVKAAFIPTTWRDLRGSLAEGRADIALNALEIREDAGVRFSSPYYVASQAIGVRANETRIYELHDLAGKKVATTRGSVAEAILMRLKPKATAMLADDTETPFRSLRNKNADAVLLEAAMVRSWIRREPRAFRLAGRPVLPRPYGAAVRRANPKLLAAVDGALAAMRKDGEHAKILRNWGLWDSLQVPVRTKPLVAKKAIGPTPKPGKRVGPLGDVPGSAEAGLETGIRVGKPIIRKGMTITTPVPHLAKPTPRPTPRRVPTARPTPPPTPMPVVAPTAPASAGAP